LRLVPALVVLVVGVLALAAVSGRLESVVPAAAAALLYVSNWWIYTGHDAPLLEHTWTLSIEEHFYLIWPIIMIGLASSRRWARVAALTGIAVICALLVIAWPEYWDGVRQSYLRGVPIVFGCAVAFVVRRPALEHRLTPAAKAMALPVLVALLALLVVPFAVDSLPMTGPTSVPGLLSACLVLSLVTARGTLTSRLMSWAPLRWMGRRAYGIYLFHFPIISLAMYQMDFGLPVEARAALGALASVGVAALSYVWIEMPFLRLKKRLLRVAPVS
jgi:peptidoglycan/LPS O-acetylase OafA/YrhL